MSLLDHKGAIIALSFITGFGAVIVLSNFLLNKTITKPVAPVPTQQSAPQTQQTAPQEVVQPPTRKIISEDSSGEDGYIVSCQWRAQSPITYRAVIGDGVKVEEGIDYPVTCVATEKNGKEDFGQYGKEIARSPVVMIDCPVASTIPSPKDVAKRYGLSGLQLLINCQGSGG